MAEIRWFGHNCFRIRAREATVMMDPVGKNTGYAMTKQTADIVTISHDHPGHNNTAQVKPDFVVIDGPGEYELHGVFVFGTRTYHDNAKGAELGYNTIFSVTLDGIRFTHLGDLGHQLNDEQLEVIEDTDVLFVPAGGGPVLSPTEMAEVVGVISPKLVIPMQFRTELGDHSRGEVGEYARHLGIQLPEPVEKLVLKPGDLGEKIDIAVLIPGT